MPKVELIYFAGCPGVPRARALLEGSGLNHFAEISQEGLEEGHPYRRFSSPTILVDGQIIAGSSNGAEACSFIDWENAELKKHFKLRQLIGDG